jgi:hypothetical protein
MTSSWDRAQSLAEKHKGGIFVRLQNHGEKIVGAFCGDPFAREVVWTGEAYERYDENDPNHRGKRPSLRVSLNIFVPGEGMKIIEFGTRAFEQVLKCRDKYGLDACCFEVERHGAKGDPKTKYSIMPDRKIDAALRAEIDAAELHDLARMGSAEDEDGPIDPAIANDLSNLLRRLPRSALDAFLEAFDVVRVKELRAKDEERARAVLRDLEAKHLPRSNGSTEVDPFG